MSIGKLTRVPLREVWKHEALDFTRWLEENIDVLSEVLDINLVGASREQSAGDFSVDLIAEDDQNRTVVVENQLEKSDHRHLGQLITYLTALDADAAIWIVSRARMEHVKAVTWLNEATSTPFYLVQVEGIRIGDSAPAALFTLIVGPSIESRAAGRTRAELGTRQSERQRFWELLLRQARDRTSLHASISPGPQNWVSASSGVRGLSFNYVVLSHRTRVELYIDTGNADENAELFERLRAQQVPIETAFGGALDWQRLETKRACRVSVDVALGGWKDEGSWEAVIPATIDAMVRLEAALRGPIEAVRRR